MISFRKSTLAISITLAGSLFVPSNLAFAKSQSETYLYFASSEVVYNDFDSKAYWSQDMLWAIDNGLIKGYLNTKHPTNKSNKTEGNWLNPYGVLTESQMVAIMFRYSKPDELNNAKPTTKWWADTAYQLAGKYGLPVNGSVKNQAKAESVVTRGVLARTLVTLHFGKQANLEDAVQWMYETGITSGKNASKGKTMENFGANDQLQRAQIVAFMKRYDDYIKSGKNIPLNSGSQPEQTPEVKEDIKVVGGIKTLYHGHTYGVKNQAEYDQVMNLAKDAIKGYQDLDSFDNQHIASYFERYLNGERPTDVAKGSLDDRGLTIIEGVVGEAVNSGVGRGDIEKLLKVAKKVSTKMQIVRSSLGGSTAYDALVLGKADCDSTAQAQAAMFESAGYQTKIAATTNHAKLLINLDGKWWDLAGGTFRLVDLNNLGSYKIYVE